MNKQKAIKMVGILIGIVIVVLFAKKVLAQTIMEQSLPQDNGTKLAASPIDWEILADRHYNDNYKTVKGLVEGSWATQVGVDHSGRQVIVFNKGAPTIGIPEDHFQGFDINGIEGNVFIHADNSDGIFKGFLIHPAYATATIRVSFSAVAHLPYVFCRQHHQTLTDPVNYNVYAEYASNGTDMGRQNEIIASYILTHEKGFYSDAGIDYGVSGDEVQRAVWADGTLSDVYPGDGPTSLNSEASNFNDYRVRLATKSGSSGGNVITANSTTPTIDYKNNSYIIGPFNLDFVEYTSIVGGRNNIQFAGIEEIKLFSQNTPGQYIEIKDFSVTDSNGNGTSITRGNNFYVKIPVGAKNVNGELVTKLGSIDVKYKNMDIWGNWYRARCQSTGHQEILIVKKAETWYSHTTLTARFNVELNADLALRKFISGVNSQAVTNRVPVATVTNGKVSYNHTKTPIEVENGDIVTYTFRLYNEGNTDAYVKQIVDNLPAGLEFSTTYQTNDGKTNSQYGWSKSSDGRIYSNYSQNTLLGKLEGTNLKYTDVKLALRVNVTESNLKNTIQNTAEISQIASSSGGPVEDQDSTPNNNKAGEDDIDYEYVKLKEGDLALRKFITSVNSTTIADRVPTPNINGTNVTYTQKKTPIEVKTGDIVTYTLRIYNEGTLGAYAKQIVENIPSGMTFDSNNSTNKTYGWYKGSDGRYYTNYLSKEYSTGNLIPALSGKNLSYKEVKIALTVTEPNMSTRQLINTAEISNDSNKNGLPMNDKDSVPNNNRAGEDDIDTETLKLKELTIAGKVWIDGAEGKGSAYNGKIDTNESGKANVKVTLYYKGTRTKVQNTQITKSDGLYKFENVDKTQKYYIEFEYNGQKYTPTIYRAGEESGNSYVYNATQFRMNSKANEDTSVRTNFNKKFSTIVQGKAQGGGKDIALTYTKDTAKHTSTLTDNDTNPDFMIQARTDIVPAGKTVPEGNYFPYGGNTEGSYWQGGSTDYLQYYNLGLIERAQTDLQVQKYFNKADVSINGYSHTYTSATLDALEKIGQTGEPGLDAVQRYTVTYLNRTYLQYYYRSDYQYQNSGQQELQIDITYKIRVKNASSKPTKVLELVDYVDNSYQIVSSNLEGGGSVNWTTNNSYGTKHNYNGYTSYYTTGLSNVTINSGEVKTINMTVRVKKGANNLLQIEDKNNIVEVNAYSTIDGLIDVNSEPGTTVPGNTSTYEDDTGSAPVISFTPFAEERSGTGVVWDDTVTTNNVFGDGYRSNAEDSKGVNGVQVKLIEIRADGSERNAVIPLNPTQYQKTTAGQGNYSFSGFIPGKYRVEFTYGGTGNTAYNAQEYKSTKFNNTTAVRYSDARDYVTQRKTLDTTWQQIKNSKTDDLKNSINTGTINMTAFTNQMVVNLNDNGTNVKNVDFGIEKRPETKIELTKTINKIKITLSNGTVLMERGGDSLPVVPQYFMDEELMQGATVEIEYKFTIINQSEKDYAVTTQDVGPYYTAVTAGWTPITTQVNHIIDYVDSELVFDIDGNQWDVSNDPNTLKNNGLIDSNVKNAINNLKNNQELNTILISKNGAIPALKPGETAELSLKLAKVISVQEDEMRYLNVGEIIQYTNQVGRRDNQSTPGNYNPQTEQNQTEKDTGRANSFSIRVPEGQTRYYYLLGIGIAVILTTGIILIKKKILK